MLGNVGEVVDGEADGVRKFGSEEQAKQMQDEFAPIACFFVEKASQFLDDVGKEHGWSIALLKAQKKGGNSLAPLWPQTPPCQCSGSRELAERITFCNTDVPICDNNAIDTKAKDFSITFVPELVEYLHVRCPCY